jgi:hypothetical protein
MQRLWAKVEQAGELDCWLWKGAMIGGYGVVYIPLDGVRCQVPVHRLLMVLCYGADFPQDQPIARHYLCGNTLCCNPRHILVGTQGDNNGDTHFDKRQPKIRRTRYRKYHHPDSKQGQELSQAHPGEMVI